MVALIAFTLACVTWSLWVRRITWHCRWEVAATLNIALQGAAVTLMSPFTSATIGRWLHSLTGHWNLEDYLAHDCYIVAASAIVYNCIGRLGDDDIMRRRFAWAVEKPATICIPLGLAFFTVGNGAHIYQPDFFDVPTDGWLTGYWTIVCGTLLWLLIYSHCALSKVGRDPRNRQMSIAYRIATSAGIIACTVRLVTAYIPSLQLREGGNLVWIFACLCGAIFAVASAYSWSRKVTNLAGAK